MPEKRSAGPATLTPAARHDFLDILNWSASEFGARAAARYRALLIQALRDIEADPLRPGSKERPELLAPAVRTYHVSFSRSRTPKPHVKTPRHFLIYRHSATGKIEVVRVLHDSTDLARHVPGE